MTENVLYLTLLPLVSFILIAFATRRAKMLSAVTALAAVSASAVLSIIVFIGVLKSPVPKEVSAVWFDIPSIGTITGLRVEMGLLIDPLSALMMVIITTVAALVILYSIGYMKGDEGFSKYFAFVSLFVFSMLGLVVSNNFFQTFAFWELVGLCSYLLIGFWFKKPAAADAGRKAFITNRWADFAFMLGIILIYTKFGTFSFRGIASGISIYGSMVPVTLAAALIFIGPVGKSAQFPLHVWLPDAMEGPTPVSALIHAATMVAAGVFLIARSFVMFQSVPAVMAAMAYIGGFTAIFAASIAIVQDDLKKILAFSTISQLGYMVMAMGIGSADAGMFHLTTHAFFKALLFLGAGSVIHAANEQNIFRLGGLKYKMPVTACTFIIGALALSGIFPLSGFWSKDEILNAALTQGHPVLYFIGTVTAFLTAFYMFRLVFTVFFGDKRSDFHAHESNWAMTAPLIILTVITVVLGLTNTSLFHKTFGQSFGTFIFSGSEAPNINIVVASVSTIAALAGIIAAWLIYVRKKVDTNLLIKKYSAVYRLLYNRYYVDELYSWLFQNSMMLAGSVFDWIDHYIVDRIFDGMAGLTGLAGKKLRAVQTGYVQYYAIVMFAALIVIILAAVIPAMGGVLK